MPIGFRRVNKQRGTTASTPLVPDTHCRAEPTEAAPGVGVLRVYEMSRRAGRIACLDKLRSARARRSNRLCGMCVRWAGLEWWQTQKSGSCVRQLSGTLRKGARHRLRLIRIGKRRKLSGISTKPGKKKVSRSAPSPAAKAAQSSSPWLGRRAKPACDRDLVRRHTATN